MGSAKKLEVSPQQQRSLRMYNAVMSVLHLLQGALMLWLSNDFAVPLKTSYLSFDVATKRIAPVINEVATVRLGPLVASFLFISGLAHLYISTIGFRSYIRNLERHANFARWYEYMLSSSVMIVVIALLCGMFDLPSLILIFAVNAAMIMFGYMMELHNQTTERTDWTAFIFGCVVGIVPWIVIAMYFFGAAASVDAIPKFVYGILVSLFVFFNIFAVNMYLQYKGVGRWKDYLFGERMYVLLSLVAKSALAWQVFSGTLRPS